MLDLHCYPGHSCLLTAGRSHWARPPCLRWLTAGGNLSRHREILMLRCIWSWAGGWSGCSRPRLWQHWQTDFGCLGHWAPGWDHWCVKRAGGVGGAGGGGERWGQSKICAQRSQCGISAWDVKLSDFNFSSIQKRKGSHVLVGNIWPVAFGTRTVQGDREPGSTITAATCSNPRRPVGAPTLLSA